MIVYKHTSAPAPDDVLSLKVTVASVTAVASDCETFHVKFLV